VRRDCDGRVTYNKTVAKVNDTVIQSCLTCLLRNKLRTPQRTINPI